MYSYQQATEETRKTSINNMYLEGSSDGRTGGVVADVLNPYIHMLKPTVFSLCLAGGTQRWVKCGLVPQNAFGWRGDHQTQTHFVDEKTQA